MGLNRSHALHMRCILTFAWLSVFLMPAFGADKKTCDAFVAENAAKSVALKSKNCGEALNNPRWSSDRKQLTSWCETASEADVKAEGDRRREEYKVCSTCRSYAAMAAAAAAENGKLGCKLEGARWAAALDAHLKWCMASIDLGEPAPGADVPPLKVRFEKLMDELSAETGGRRADLAMCRSQKAR